MRIVIKGGKNSMKKLKKERYKPTGVLSAPELKTAYGKFLYWLFFTVLCIVVICSVLPAIWTIATAFKGPGEIYTSRSFFPHEFSLPSAKEQILEAWNKLDLTEATINTVIMSLGQLVFKIVVACFGGYVLSKLKPKGTKFIFALVVWTMMMPSQIRLVPNYMTYLHFPFASKGGVSLLDTFWPMWLTAGADTFAVLLFKNAFDGLSSAYVEAAKIDGCSNYGIVFKIMIPLVAPVLMYESIMVLSAAWSDFFTPLLVLDKKRVMPLVIYRLRSDGSIKMNTYFMILVLASIPPFLIYVIFQRWIMGGVNIGGVKG